MIRLAGRCSGPGSLYCSLRMAACESTQMWTLVQGGSVHCLLVPRLIRRPCSAILGSLQSRTALRRTPICLCPSMSSTSSTRSRAMLRCCLCILSLFSSCPSRGTSRRLFQCAFSPPLLLPPCHPRSGPCLLERPLALSTRYAMLLLWCRYWFPQQLSVPAAVTVSPFFSRCI